MSSNAEKNPFWQDIELFDVSNAKINIGTFFEILKFHSKNVKKVDFSLWSNCATTETQHFGLLHDYTSKRLKSMVFFEKNSSLLRVKNYTFFRVFCSLWAGTHLSDPMPRSMSLVWWAIWASFAHKRHSMCRGRGRSRWFAPTGSPFGVKRAGRDRTWASHRGRCRFICKKKSEIVVTFEMVKFYLHVCPRTTYVLWLKTRACAYNAIN